MLLDYEVIVRGNSLRLRDDFLGMSSITLLHLPQGLMLVDTGGYIARLGLIKALRDRGLTPADVRYVFLTHLHFDHSHNVDLFPHATFYVSRAEWDYALNPHPDDILMPWCIHAQLQKGTLELIDGEGDLVPGLTYFPTPGHTPGCYSLQLTAKDRARVIIAGDAIKHAKEAIMARCDNAFDTIETGTKSIQRILQSADRIVPGHFPELIRIESGAFSWNDSAEFSLLVR
jgi:N-acyl homoserine lactone hydrolase